MPHSAHPLTPTRWRSEIDLGSGWTLVGRTAPNPPRCSAYDLLCFSGQPPAPSTQRGGVVIHPSLAFPSFLVVVLEAVLLLAALLLLGGARSSEWSGLLWKGIHRLALVRGGPVLLAAAVGLASGIATTALLGPPVPHVDDEFSYLLAADTFAHGRLTNPPHPHWLHFDTIHVLQKPTYASKYPPAQGAILAAGRLLGGHEVVGLWLSIALLGGAVAWLLLAWFPPPWALLGAGLAVIHLGLGSYWGHTYWGGAVAAVGGALLYGGLGRWRRDGRARHAVAMAVGILVLTNSRPYEGLLVVLPAAVALLVWGSSGALAGRRVRTILALTLALAPGALWMLHYNARVTGDPLQLPYQLHQRTHNPRPNFIFLEPTGELRYGNRAVEAFWRRYQPAAAEDSPPWALRYARQTLERSSPTLYALLGAGPALLLIGLFAPGRPSWTTPLLAACLLVVLGQGLVASWWPHYPAPATGLLIALSLAGARHIQAWRWRGRRLGRYPASAALVVVMVLALAQLPAMRPSPGDWSRERLDLESSLLAQEGRHLVLIPFASGLSWAWVWNRADIDGSQVVWAHEVGPEEDRALLEYFADRLVWRLEGGERGTARRLAPVARGDGTPPLTD
jgi:hypothetical protein